MNLTERAEIRKETFYKLTNSAEAPTAPSEGGRNLLRKTAVNTENLKLFGTTDTTVSVVEKDGHQAYKLVVSGSSNAGAYFNGNNAYYNLVKDRNYTFSFWVLTNKDKNYNINSLGHIQTVNTNSDKVGNDFMHQHTWPVYSTNVIKANTWTKVWCTFKATSNSYFKPYFWYLTAGDEIYIYDMMLNKNSAPVPYSQAPEDLGWSTITLVPTQQQRYLWKFEYVYYSDDSVEITQPVNISIAGADGTNGQTSHVHFAFADNATGGGFSLTTPKAYMGWYADFNESASNDPTKYKWGKWKGDQGVPGQKGDDGKTSYFHLAYASSADGKTGFSFKESGQQYQGYYTDFTQTSSTDPTKYTWMDRRAGVEVGGRNLYIISKASKGFISVNSEALGTQGSKEKEYTSDFIPVSPNEKYMFQGWVTIPESGGSWRSWQFYGADKKKVGDRATNGGQATVGLQHYIHAITVPNNTNIKYIRVSARLYEDGKLKLERGNIVTDYSLAPEDTQEQIDSKADQALTQEQLNALAEKNRNMEAEMAAKASLAELEQWKQAYDAYVAQNDADKTSAEQKLITLTSRVAEWAKDWEDKKVQWSFLDTNMDFGEEGLRLGKKGSPTSILISNDRIGFYSGGSEVASMSNGTLTIDNGIFAKSLQIGHYREEVYEGDKTINVVRWID